MGPLDPKNRPDHVTQASKVRKPQVVPTFSRRERLADQPASRSLRPTGVRGNGTGRARNSPRRPGYGLPEQYPIASRSSTGPFFDGTPASRASFSRLCSATSMMSLIATLFSFHVWCIHLDGEGSGRGLRFCVVVRNTWMDAAKVAGIPRKAIGPPSRWRRC
jgi:hypothetical protein